MNKKFINSLIIIFLFLLTCASVFASESKVPEGAKQYAEEYFPKLFENYYQKLDDPTKYGLDEELGSISFGPLHPVNTFTKEFKQKKISKAAKKQVIEPTNLWISVVYQNGKPRLAISVYQKPDGTYSFANIGYGEDVALAIEKVKEGEQVVDEGPTHSWFAYSPDKSNPSNSKIRPLNDAAKKMISSETRISEFQDNMERVYKQKAEIEVDDPMGITDDSISGGALYSESEISLGKAWIIGLGLIFIVIIIIRIRPPCR